MSILHLCVSFGRHLVLNCCSGSPGVKRQPAGLSKGMWSLSIICARVYFSGVLEQIFSTRPLRACGLASQLICGVCQQRSWISVSWATMQPSSSLLPRHRLFSRKRRWLHPITVLLSRGRVRTSDMIRAGWVWPSGPAGSTQDSSIIHSQIFKLSNRLGADPFTLFAAKTGL